MKRKIITFVIIILCFLLQSTIFDKLQFGHIEPNLFVIVTASFGFMRGQKSGMYVGILCGFLADMFWGNHLGFYMLLFVVIGYLNGSFKRLFYEDDIQLPLVLIAASEMIYGIVVYVFSYMLQGDFQFLSHLFHVIIPELVYTILVTLVLYQVILYVNKKLESEEQRSASKFV